MYWIVFFTFYSINSWPKFSAWWLIHRFSYHGNSLSFRFLFVQRRTKLSSSNSAMSFCWRWINWLFNCYSEDGCCYVTSNVHFLFKLLRKLLVQFCSPVGKYLLTSKRLILTSKRQVKTIFLIWLSSSLFDHCKKVDWNNCSTRWLTFNSSISFCLFAPLTHVQAQCDRVCYERTDFEDRRIDL